MNIKNKKNIYLVIFLIDCIMIYAYCSNILQFSANFIAILMLILTNILMFMIISLYEKKQKLEILGKTDLLTGGNNRNGFFYEAEKILSSEKNNISNYIVVNLNISDFKTLNLKFGEKGADQILIKIYNIFNSHLKTNEVLSRNGIDYFLFLLHDPSDNRVEAFIDHMIEHIQCIDPDLKIGFTIGACRISSAETLQSTVNKATYMMNQSNEINRCIFFNEEFTRKEREKKELLDSFESALKNKEFQVYLQPIVPLDHNRTLFAEALVRWNHPQRGLLYPDQFIPLLENHNKIDQLDLYMFESVCRIMEKCLSESKSCISISVNLSRIHLKNRGINICDDYLKIKSKYNIPDGAIKLEITENFVFEFRDIKVVQNIIDKFHSMGLKVGLDDFGVAFSSIALLKDFPIDILKLDRLFFLNENHKSYKIVRKLIELAHELGMIVVSEGIEDQEQVDKLRELGCNYIQGYIFSKPIPFDEFIQWKQDHKNLFK